MFVSDCCYFSDINISQGSVGTLEMWWTLQWQLYSVFTAGLQMKRVLKIGQ